MKTRKNLFMMISLVFLFLLGLSSFGTGTVFAKYEDKVKPGEFVVEPPTLICLGFEWYIEGDENRNAKVDVWYRKKGESSWKQGLPLFRLQNEMINTYTNPPDQNFFDYIAPNMFAGSIFDLEADTEYECEFIMEDPDGVRGDLRGWGDHHKGHWEYQHGKWKAHKVVTVRTRAEPTPFAEGRVLHVYPSGYTGTKQSPNFTGLMAAYAPGGANMATQFNGAQPGDIILVHAGTYKRDQSDFPYYSLNRSGTLDKPIVIMGAGDGEVIFDGLNSPVLFDVKGGNYTYFEGITIRNAGIGIVAGEKNVIGANGLTVKRCLFEDVGTGIWAMYAKSRNFYIADNTFLGRQKQDGLTGNGANWRNYPGYPANQYTSNYGIHIWGSGHVVAYNHIAYFYDGITTSFYHSMPTEIEMDKEQRQVSNDFYNNYIHTVSDNCTSVEEQWHNARVFRNLLMNDGSAPIGLSHIWGGPIYVFRNIVYHAPSLNAVKLFGASGGAAIYHNTLLTEVQLADIFGAPSGSIPQRAVSNVDFRNNLVLGEESIFNVPSRFKPGFTGVYYVSTYTSYTSSDCNGFRPTPGGSPQFVWVTSSSGALRDYVTPRVEQDFDTLPQLCQATGQECHGILVDYDIFENVAQADRSDPTILYSPEFMDFRLKPDAVAVDAACRLPNINDGFTGAAPDLGALEVGQPMPHYGPRP